MRKLYFLLFPLIISARLFSQNYTILGNASQLPQCNCYQLTPNQGGQAGAIFQNNTINMNNSFDFTFSNFFGCNGASGADGEAFVLTTNPNGLGNQGEGLGYGGSNQPCSFAIEFDTWQNTDHGDPPYDHTAYESGGSVNHNVVGPVPAIPSQSNLDNCQWHTIHIVWDANTQTMYDYIDGVLRISQQLTGFINNYLCGNPIVNWGWTGSTGGGWNLQQVCMKSISDWVAANNYQSCTPTVQFTDISTSNIGSVRSWDWIFGDGSTSNLQNPSHTYADTGTFTATLIITDVSGCTDTFSHIVHIAGPIILTPTVVNPLCNGAHTGSISLAEQGGFGPSAGHGGFIYNWSDGDYGATDVGIGAGTYTVTCTDGICTTTGQYTLNQPTALTATTSSTAASCNTANGTCTITISGGTPPYQDVTWAGVTGTTVGNTTTVGGFLGGTYIANFEDANGCSALLQYTATVVTLPCGISASSSSTNVTCFGGSNGSVTLTVIGGAAGPTITWTNAGGTTVGTGATVNNLPAGTYTYSYTDANPANAFTGTLVVTQPGAAMVVSLLTNNISCAGANNGRATASVTSGGAQPFTYQWSGGGPNNPVDNNLGPGAITVTVTDANGCTATATGTISSVTPLAINVTTTTNACNQFNNGSATANVTGGTTPYIYRWSNIASAQTDLSLGAGTYFVTVTDSNGCSITGSGTIGESQPFINIIDSTNVLCHGDSTGTITVNSSGGATPYNYQWSSDTAGDVNPGLVGGSLTNLLAGEYLLTVTDANGCTFFDSTFLQQPLTALTVNTVITNVSCYNSANGSILTTITGGTPPYTFTPQGLPGIIVPGTIAINNLSDTIITGTITDANGCSYAVNDTVTQPGVQSISVTEVDNTCNGGHAGSATALFTNATGNVNYVWSNSMTGATITGLDSAKYYVTATDANSCKFIDSTTVSQPVPVQMDTLVANPPCFGGKGFVTVTPNGGNAPFVYVWTAGGSATSTDSLGMGSYSVTSTDANGCRQTAAFTVSQPPSITQQAAVTNVACFGGNTGAITITAGGGTNPYTYAWTPNVSTTNAANALQAGQYVVTITDAAGCSIDTSLTVAQPQVLSAIYTVTNVACNPGNGINAGNTGSIDIATSGGTAPYSYSWTPVSASSSDSATQLVAGNYSVTITDANFCTVDSSFIITQPAQALTLDSSHVNLTCYESNDGSASVTASGGTSPYSYVWSPNTITSTTNSATNLPAGSISVVVTDNNQCAVSLPFVISQPSQIIPVPTVTNVKCHGGATGTIAISTTGGVPGYTYGWTPNVSITDSANNVVAGNYTITVTDATGCTASASSTVSQSPAFQLTTSSTQVDCFGDSTGTITVTATGGVPGYNFVASNGASIYTNTTGQFSGLPSGNYTIALSDQDGCPDTTTANVSTPNPLMDVISYSNPSCTYLNNGKIILSATGGNPGYSFSSTGLTTNSSGLFTRLAAGNYIITITDTKGCKTTDSATLTKPDTLYVNVTPAPAQAKLGDTLALSTTVSQSGNIVYSWTPKFGLSCYDCADPVFEGVYSQPYTVTVINDSGCVAGFTFDITVVPDYNFFVPNAFTPNGDGKNDFWQIYGNTSAIKQLNVKVFDRIGEKVFESEDINFKWDGTFKGHPAQIGVYVYEIQIVWLDNHSDGAISGSLTLLK